MGPFFVYIAWLTLIYGGFAAIIYALRRKIDQTTATLRATELARERNEAAIAEARVRALVERIEPRFLIDVMASARDQYRVAPIQAEATLNACVAFLRAAMPQLRSGHSTVAAELELAEAYLMLRDHIECGIDARKRDWHVDRQPASACAVDLARVQLPPMVLLPLLEHLRRPLIVSVVAQDDSIEIGLKSSTVVEAGDENTAGSAIALDAESLDAIASRLALVCGRDAAIRTEVADNMTRLVRIIVPRTHPFERPLDRSSGRSRT